jgi:hypothetical protein
MSGNSTQNAALPGQASIELVAFFDLLEMGKLQ